MMSVQIFSLLICAYLGINKQCSLKGQCHEFFYPLFFSSNNTSWAPDSRDKAFLNSASNSPRYDQFYEICLLGRPFKFIYIFSGGIGQFGNIYVFDRYSL
jgi:hypothetical protein